MNWQSILKSYDLNEFIIQKDDKKGKRKKISKPKKKEKKTTKLPNGDSVEIDYVDDFENVIDELANWIDKCKQVSNEDLGVTGQKGSSNLFDFLKKHVTDEVKRPGVGDFGDGVWELIKDLVDIVKQKDLHDEKVIDDMDLFIEALERMGGKNSKTNPQNIPFTVPSVVGKDGATEWVKVHGHYRTPLYIKHRKAIGKEENVSAVPKHFYDEDPGKAQPPFWQALFGECASETKDIKGIDNGLLPILKKYEEFIEGDVGPIATIPEYRIKGKFERQAIEKIPSFLVKLTEILSRPNSYRDATQEKPFDRLWVNFAAINRAFKIEPIDVADDGGEEDSDAFLRLLNLKNLQGRYEIEEVYFQDISIRLLRTILKNIENNELITTNNFLDTHKHGKLEGMFLEKPINQKESRKDLWDAEIKRLKREGKEIPPWARPPDSPPEGGSDEKKMLKSHWTDYLRRY